MEKQETNPFKRLREERIQLLRKKLAEYEMETGVTFKKMMEYIKILEDRNKKLKLQ